MSIAPEAFASTYERELARSTADWQKWLSPGATFVLEDHAGAQGMAAGVHDTDNSAIVHLMAMWVSPEIRGSGGADALVAAVVGWAESQAAASVRLVVMEANGRARRVYERNGFRTTGLTTVRERDGGIELEMERRVNRERKE